MSVQPVPQAPRVEHANAVPPAFDCSWATDGRDAAWVHLAGELDIATTPRLEQALRDCLWAARLVVVDLYDLSFIGSCGVDAIVDASVRARRDGRRVVLLRAVRDVELVFTLTGSFEDVEIIDLAPTRPIGPMVVKLSAANERPRADAEEALTARRLAAGEGEALATRYGRHAGRAFSVAHRTCGDECAEDVAVQAFSSLRDNGRAGPILGRIGPRLSRLTRECARQEVAAADAPARPLHPAVAELYERHAADALASVVPAERRCIELAYFDGLSVSEIALRCGLSITTVNGHLRRGLNSMMRHLRSVARRDAQRGGGAPAL